MYLFKSQKVTILKMSRVEKYEKELDDSLEKVLDSFPEAEGTLLACKELCFKDLQPNDQTRNIVFQKIRGECTEEIKELWKSIEKGSDLNAAATVDYIVNGYNLLDENEQALLA